MGDKKVSVIMGIYNCSEYLPDAINSILNQTYKNFELILCDDKSTDNTYEVAKTFADMYPDKIILIQNEVNSKLSYTLNHCLKYASGEYVARMDADDLSTPDRLQKQVEFLESHLDIDLVGTSMKRFDDDGEIDVVLKPEFPNKYDLKKGVPFNHATIMTYKRVYDAVSGYRVSKMTVRSQDYDLWFRFFAKGFKGVNLAEPLYLVREDAAAIRRRTFKVRWNVIKIRYHGYKLIGFPISSLIIPSAVEILKGLVPYSLIDMYRKYQKKKFNVKKDK